MEQEAGPATGPWLLDVPHGERFVTASPAEMRHRRYALKWTEMTEIVPAPISLFSIAGTFNDPSRRSRRRSRI